MNTIEVNATEQRICPPLGGASHKPSSREWGLQQEQASTMDQLQAELVLALLLIAVVILSART